LKPLNTVEIDALIESLDVLTNAQAQDCSGSLDAMVFKFWSGHLSFLMFQIKGNTPLFFFTSDKSDLEPRHLKKTDKKPFFLFYQKHFKGARLAGVSRSQKYGRLVDFNFESETGVDLKLEFRLFPGGVNLGLHAGGKSVYVKKPLELTEFVDDYEPKSIRSPEVIKEEWRETLSQDQKNKPSTKAEGDSVKAQNADKVKLAKSKIRSAIAFLKSEPHRQFAKILQNKSSLPDDLKSLYKEDLTLQENIEWAFEKHKENPLKLKRLEERLEQLDHNNIKNNLANSFAKPKVHLKATRHLTLSSEVRAFCGKSAKENMDLLRKSKSWHIWMHLKDHPSGHLILSFPKNHSVQEEELKRSALFLFKVAAPKKLHAAEQVKFEVIFTETKFVKPIKGAKTGLVQPSRTRTRLFLWNKSENLTF